jgi:hypothetical protein
MMPEGLRGLAWSIASQQRLLLTRVGWLLDALGDTKYYYLVRITPPHAMQQKFSSRKNDKCKKMSLLQDILSRLGL